QAVRPFDDPAVRPGQRREVGGAPTGGGREPVRGRRRAQGDQNEGGERGAVTEGGILVGAPGAVGRLAPREEVSGRGERAVDAFGPGRFRGGGPPAVPAAAAGEARGRSESQPEGPPEVPGDHHRQTYLLASFIFVATGTGARSAMRTSRAADVQKVLPVMQWCPDQLPSPSWARDRPSVIFLSHFSHASPPLTSRVSLMLM